MKSCPRCRSEQSWTLADGRRKCHRCGSRYSWRSVWDGVRLPETTRHDLLEAFVQGVTAYRRRFDAGACVDSRERFDRLARACCALDSSVDSSAVLVTNCERSSGDVRPHLRGWSTAARVVVLAFAGNEGRVRMSSSPINAPEVIATLRERTAIGGVYCLNENQALANLQVHGNYVVVQRCRRASLAMTPIEIFWEYASERLRTFRQIPCRSFHLYLGEVCFRFNHRGRDVSQALGSLLHSISMAQAKAVIAWRPAGPETSGARTIGGNSSTPTLGERATACV